MGFVLVGAFVLSECSFILAIIQSIDEFSWSRPSSLSSRSDVGLAFPSAPFSGDCVTQDELCVNSLVEPYKTSGELQRYCST